MSCFVSADKPLFYPLGSRSLLYGQAMSLRSGRAAVLRVIGGRLWVTSGESDAGVPGNSGDRFLGPGERLCVPAWARLVMEPFSIQGDAAPVYFEWVEEVWAPSRFSRDVARPAEELISALKQAGGALARLLKGLLGYSGLFETVPGEVACGVSKHL